MDRTTSHQTPERGVLAIAHSGRKYATQAINLARSVRFHSPGIPLAVATDLDESLFKGIYDHVIPWDFSEWNGLVAKLEAFRMSPFARTLYLDVDCLTVAPLDDVFDYFEGRNFAVFGRNEASPPWFESMDAIRGVVNSITYPVFNGGLYYFTKSVEADRVFQNAKKYFFNYDTLRLRHNHGKPNDEPLFSLAMAEDQLTATADSRLDVMFAPERPRFAIHIDVLRGECWFPRIGRVVRPVIAHFVGARDSGYAYRREVLRLGAAGSIHRHLSPWQEARIRVIAAGGFLLHSLLHKSRSALTRMRGETRRWHPSFLSH